MKVTLYVVAVVVLTTATAVPPVLAQGSVKGQVTWSDKAIPKNEEAKVDKDRVVCLARGKIYKDQLIVDAKTKGVKNVVFWLVDARDPLGKIATPAALKGKDVVIDQPCCVFIPRHTIILEGQNLVVANPATITHNIKIDGGPDGPNINVAMPPKTNLQIGAVKARSFPIIPYSCSIHSWMNGYLMALPTPYYAMTGPDGTFEIKDVPAGEYRIVGWHERIGWIFPGPNLAVRNKPVTVKDKAATDLGALPRKVEDDD